ncbi:MAG: hypothetical protein WC490_00755 [Candidatus Margulisiibacteriota bacterium]
MRLEQGLQIGGQSKAGSARLKVVERDPRTVQGSERPLESGPSAVERLEQRPKVTDFSQDDIDRTAYFEGFPPEDYRIIARITRDILRESDLSRFKTSKELSAFMKEELLKRLEGYPQVKDIFQRHLARPEMAGLVAEKRTQLLDYTFSGMSREDRAALMKPIEDAINKAVGAGTPLEKALVSYDVQKAYFDMEKILQNIPLYKDALAELLSKDKLFEEIFAFQEGFRAREMAQGPVGRPIISALVYSYTDDKDSKEALGKLGIDTKRLGREQARRLAVLGGLEQDEASAMLNGLKDIRSSKAYVVSLDVKSGIEAHLAEKPLALAAYKKMLENTRPIPELGRITYKRMLDTQIEMLHALPDGEEKQAAIRHCEESLEALKAVPDKEVGMSLVQAAYIELKELEEGARRVLSSTDNKYREMVATYEDVKSLYAQKLFCDCIRDPQTKEAIGAMEWDADKMSFLSPEDLMSAISAKLGSAELSRDQKQRLNYLLALCFEEAGKVQEVGAFQSKIGMYEIGFRNELYRSMRAEIAKRPYGASLVAICDSLIDVELKELNELFQPPKTNEQILSV